MRAAPIRRNSPESYSLLFAVLYVLLFALSVQAENDFIRDFFASRRREMPEKRPVESPPGSAA